MRKIQLLYAFAILMVALRWAFPLDTVYTLDEPFQQIRLDEHFAAHTIPFSNSRGSSIPLPYGPGALWIWMLVRLFTWHPLAIVFTSLVLQTLGFAIFARTFLREYGEETAAWCVALAASSPALFFFARHPWDPTLLIPLGAAILWALWRLEKGGHELGFHALLGVLGGYGANTHLMFGPVLLALGLTLLIRDWRLKKWQSWIPLTVFSFCALAVLAPYLLEAFRIAREENSLSAEHARVKNHWGDLRNVWWLVQRSVLFSSLFQSRLHLEESGVRQQLEHFVGPVVGFLFHNDLFGWFTKIAAWACAVCVAARKFRASLIQIFAVLAFFLSVLVDEFLNIPTSAHYFAPIWFFVFVGVAWALPKLAGLKRTVFLGFLVATILVNTAFVGAAMAFIHVNHGARNGEMSVVLGEQLRMFREVCEGARAKGLTKLRIDRGHTVIEEPPFQFIPAHMPECAGISVELTTGPADVVLSHPKDSETSAALQLR